MNASDIMISRYGILDSRRYKRDHRRMMHIVTTAVAGLTCLAVAGYVWIADQLSQTADIPFVLVVASMCLTVVTWALCRDFRGERP